MWFLARELKLPSIARGTDGSNPSPSSGESHKLDHRDPTSAVPTSALIADGGGAGDAATGLHRALRVRPGHAVAVAGEVADLRRFRVDLSGLIAARRTIGSGRKTRCSGRPGHQRGCEPVVADRADAGDGVLPANPVQEGIIGMASGSRPSRWAPCRRDHCWRPCSNRPPTQDRGLTCIGRLQRRRRESPAYPMSFSRGRRARHR